MIKYLFNLYRRRRLRRQAVADWLQYWGYEKLAIMARRGRLKWPLDGWLSFVKGLGPSEVNDYLKRAKVARQGLDAGERRRAASIDMFNKLKEK